MFIVEQALAMGIVLFTIVKHSVSHDERGNLITRTEYFESFTSHAEADQVLLTYNN
jgi:hypothetical protein